MWCGFAQFCRVSCGALWSRIFCTEVQAEQHWEGNIRGEAEVGHMYQQRMHFITAQVIKHNSAVPAKREATLHAEEDDQPVAHLDIYEGCDPYCNFNAEPNHASCAHLQLHAPLTHM